MYYQDLPDLRRYHYAVDHLIGSGGTANVYFGINLRTGFPVAIKELLHIRNPYLRQQFKDVETQLYLRLGAGNGHPNIPALDNFLLCPETDQMFLIMEFVPGKTLTRYIQDVALIPEKTALPIFLEILDTVGFLHERGVVHLDIKPNNVIIKPDRGVKLIDLGIASRMGEFSSVVAGTPPYMPPEQWDNGTLGTYTDIYALGMLLFEMLTGQVAFDAPMTNSKEAALAEISRMAHHASLPQMRDYYSHIGMPLQEIVEKATRKNPTERYQTCSEFANALKQYMRQEGI